MAETNDHPVLFAIFGLNRAGQILWGLLFVAGAAGFVLWTMLPELRFSEQDELLFKAARHGDRGGVERALDAGASPSDVSPVDHKTALFRAAVFGHAEVVKLLLERGADPNARGGDGRSALEVVTAARGEEKEPAAAKALDAVAAVLRESTESR